MSHRFLTTLLLAAASLAPLQLAGQTAPKRWTQPKTADGQPDLQGVWTNPTITPFERPVELAGKPVLTDQEAAALEEKAAENRVDVRPGRGRRGQLQPGLVRFGHQSGGDPADVAGGGSARRTRSAEAGGGSRRGLQSRTTPIPTNT